MGKSEMKKKGLDNDRIGRFFSYRSKFSNFDIEIFIFFSLYPQFR